MSEIKDGGPAFPSHGTMGEVNHQGMSLRDYYAGQAIVGTRSIMNFYNDGTIDGIVNDAYKLADAMIEAREKAGRDE